MKIKINYFLLYFLLSLNIFINIPAQDIIFPQNSPEWLVDMFFKKTYFPDKELYFIGDMLQDVNYPTIGEELDGRGNVSFRVIDLNDQNAVYSIDIKDNKSKVNFYCYLQKVSGNWKIEAVRKFQFPDFIYSSADSLSRIENLPDSVSSLLGSLELMTGTDENLKTFLSENINDFYNIVSAFKNNETEVLKFHMSKLNLDYIFIDDLYPRCIFILPGKFNRIEVGFIYSKNNSALPKITPGRYIYVEEVLLNWYVFRAM